MKLHFDIKERKMAGALAAAFFISGGYLVAAFHPGVPYSEFVAAISMVYASFVYLHPLSNSVRESTL